ncbi:unnamed protein product [marine sediment metagenome]|uniref:Uncharacterized protein n=1 Tax=marine sediment metagenome TaxID=412755 RepID=X0RX06_9ZZZZ
MAKGKKKIMPKEKICPILTITPVINRGENGFVKCQGEICALFKGEEIKEDGICAISDIPGWLQHLHNLAASPTQAAPSQAPTVEPEDEKAGPTDPEEE